jgi:hypothetical protein
VSERTLDARKLAAARLWATTRLPYLANAIFASTVVADPDSGTIAIDRTWRIHGDPAVVDRLTVDQLGRLLVHLSAHAIRDSPRRTTSGPATAHGAGIAARAPTDATVPATASGTSIRSRPNCCA